MEKSEEILEKHIVLNDCIGYLGSDGRLYKAIIDALNEAINYTHSCTELCDKEKQAYEKGWEDGAKVGADDVSSRMQHNYLQRIADKRSKTDR